ncbi:LLM class flavin-dependent oxidoreductase [Ruania halotolerans]|uniref:LLM class flavin-dependent oxidoreductase n=1 Tax=Ruania halotolerans TaxID=2897773 RepID=UPI001E2A0E7E|nr:LLM class flavin-dependent oxidoreductase [Ruania halotolerans]UFU06238.1 LLM class flavin-dependent oxidoreductase [Ruania halotolerans]
MVSIGLIIPPDQPPERFPVAAHAAERAGLDEVWLWEDCFAESGIGAAAALLASTERIRVGIGLVPVPLRNVALTAMEVATLERLYPGRFLPGFGHGILPWMGQVGARVRSPLTLLREHTSALRALLEGESVTVSGTYVTLTDVQLRWPPQECPPLLIGAEGPKTLQVAGEYGDGVILIRDFAEGAERARAAHRASGRTGTFDVTTFLTVSVEADPDELTEAIAGCVAAGATRIPVVGVEGPDGPPDGSAAILRLAERLGDVRARMNE